MSVLVPKMPLFFNTWLLTIFIVYVFLYGLIFLGYIVVQYGIDDRFYGGFQEWSEFS